MSSLKLLAAIPDVELAHPSEVLSGIDDSVAYLESDAALASIAADPYWPKWHSPWWHMLALFELGEARRIPARVVSAMVGAIDALPIHIFPIQPEDVPAGLDMFRHASCHCALGCMAQVLAACGVDTARALPWVAPWFPRYQLADGGLNCDSAAYLVRDEVPSSMVGTIAPFEAAMLGAPSDFAERAAKFLIERELRFGSNTKHNAEERDAAKKWLLPTFPRFYFYDVLRGLSALARWRRPIPLRAIEQVVLHLATRFPDGIVRVERRAFAGIPTRYLANDGDWIRGPDASTFPLLEAISVIGSASPTLTRQWRETRAQLLSAPIN